MVLLRDVGHNRKNIQSATGCHSEPCPESNRRVCPESNRRTCHETFGFTKDKSVEGGVMNPKNFLQYLFSNYINILISTVIGGQPNVLIIYDNSLSMGDNFGLDQLGNWDTDSVITRCEVYQSVSTNYAKAHCIGNASGTNPCGSTACTGSRTGTCEEPDDFERFLVCIETKYPSLFSSVYGTVVPDACPGGGTDPRVECTTDTERAHSAAAIENEALKQANAADPTNFPLNCVFESITKNCTSDADKSCNQD